MSALRGYSGGYPCLRIARHYGVDYGVALQFEPAGAVPPEFNMANTTGMDQFFDFRLDVLVTRAHFKLLRDGIIDKDTPFDSVRPLA